MLEDWVRGEALISSAHLIGDIRALAREALHVRFVDERLLPATMRAPVVLPIPARIDHDRFRNERRAVASVEGEVALGRARIVAEQRVACAPAPAKLARIGVEQQLVRIETVALLRRIGPMDAEPTSPFTFGPWKIEPDNRTASKGTVVVELTARDLEILEVFARDKGRILSRRLLLTEIWGFPNPDRLETRSVDMHIAKLRKKLGAPDDALIETIRGEGYRFRG